MNMDMHNEDPNNLAYSECHHISFHLGFNASLNNANELCQLENANAFVINKR